MSGMPSASRSRLPDLAPSEAQVCVEEPLWRHTTLRIGGPAEVFCRVFREAGLLSVLRWAAEDGRLVRVLGKGSNVLAADAGFRGAVLMLEGEFLEVRIEADRVICGGGAGLGGVSAAAARAGLAGLEPLSGIPSSLGGAVRINAGAYGGQIFDVLESVRLVSARGEVREVAACEIPHGYRWTRLIETGEIVSRATLRLRLGRVEAIAEKMRDVAEKRKGALPAAANAGSIFKNPPADYAGRLIEACGLKGVRCGGAEISMRHANVIVNTGGALASDVLTLMHRMRDAVREKFGVTLVPEIDFLGMAWE
jgi:UDP-N-acetylmuramate dehydrogenase